MVQNLIWCSFLILPACLILFLEVSEAAPWKAESRPDQWWINRHNFYKNFTVQFKDNVEAIFYGDSLTEGWAGNGYSIFAHNYVRPLTADYGIGGDRTEHLLYRISSGEVEGLTKTKLVCLMIGANNHQNTPDDTVRGIKAVVDLLHQRLPKAKILLLGLLPAFNNTALFARHADINIKISKLANNKGGKSVSFLNMFDNFAIGWGQLDMTLYSADSVHLETAGYQTWADTMNPYFKMLMK